MGMKCPGKKRTRNVRRADSQWLEPIIERKNDIRKNDIRIISAKKAL